MDYPSFDLNEKVAVVTGASKGIGFGLSKSLAHAGAKVIVAARNITQLKGLVEEIEKEGGEAYPMVLDVTNLSNIEEVMNEINNKFGRIDILVNNAGLGANHPAVEVTEKDWDDMMDVNLKGLIFLLSICRQNNA